MRSFASELLLFCSGFPVLHIPVQLQLVFRASRMAGARSGHLSTENFLGILVLKDPRILKEALSVPEFRPKLRDGRGHGETSYKEG